MSSFKIEVIADSSGKWVGNGCRYPTREMAERAARNLSDRWTLVRDYRAVPSEDAPNYTADEFGVTHVIKPE